LELCWVLWKEEQYKEWREDIKKHPEKLGKLHITEDSFTFEFNDKNKKNKYYDLRKNLLGENLSN